MVESGDGVEGDVAVMASWAFDIDEHMCLNFDLYLVLSNSSSENKLRINLVTSQSQMFPSMTIHEISEWSNNQWESFSLPLPSGIYIVQFEYTLGIPYRSIAAIDNVQIAQCRTENIGRNHTDAQGMIFCWVIVKVATQVYLNLINGWLTLQYNDTISPVLEFPV